MQADGLARRAADLAARESFGRLVAILAARSGDIAAAEDALADAFASALRVWPKTGVPARPEAWLLVAARRTLGHRRRHQDVEARSAALIALLDAERGDRATADFPDERLKLLFVCAHPAIDEAARTPLMLQTVLGLDAARIAAAFVVEPAAMGQRLVRAKAKIRDAGLAFAVPDPGHLAARLDDVLQAIYAAFGTGWDEAAGGGDDALTGEAIYLARLICALLPGEPEALGLLALMLYCEARRPARRDAAGRYVPLDQQDARLWNRDGIVEAEGLLVTAARIGRFGRFQGEAAIQSVHIQRPITGRTDYRAIAALYDLLARDVATLGILVGRATAHGHARGPATALALLDELPPDRVAGYQPYWAALAHFARAAGQHDRAAAARDRAITLSRDPAVRAWLSNQ